MLAFMPYRTILTSYGYLSLTYSNGIYTVDVSQMFIELSNLSAHYNNTNYQSSLITLQAENMNYYLIFNKQSVSFRFIQWRSNINNYIDIENDFIVFM